MRRVRLLVALAASSLAWAAEVRATVTEGFSGALSVDLPLPADLPPGAILQGVQVGCASCLRLSTDNGFPKPAPAAGPLRTVPVRWELDTRGRKAAVSTEITWAISATDGAPIGVKPMKVVVDIRPWIDFPKPLIQVIDAKAGQDIPIELTGPLTEAVVGAIRPSITKGGDQASRVHAEKVDEVVRAGFAFKAGHNGLYTVELRIADDARGHTETFLFSVTDAVVDQPTLALGASMVGEVVETPIRLFEGVEIKSVRSDSAGFAIESFSIVPKVLLVKARILKPGGHKGAIHIVSATGETILPFTLVGIKP